MNVLFQFAENRSVVGTVKKMLLSGGWISLEYAFTIVVQAQHIGM
jgi:hypothetical protein